ncbi:hypothetical protein BS78_01G318000 [Paspalum vaginatum]|nr:hypothetical protein BS78_01G318000 [Paspalum vaginatum]
MAEMVGSVVVGEVVNRASSFLVGRHRDRLSTRECVERLEMAHIKMEAALEVSARWPQAAADASLRRWRRRLRRAADDCDAALHRWKLRELREEHARERLARAPLPRRVASAVLRFVSALLRRARGEPPGARAAVQRFERLAAGAAEFLRYVELGSAPRPCGGMLVFADGPAAAAGRKLPLPGRQHAGYGRLQGAQQHRFLGAGPGPARTPAEIVRVETCKPCRAYGGKRRAASSGKKGLLLV